MLGKKYRVPIQSFPKNAKTIFSGGLIVLKSSANKVLRNRAGVIIRKGVVKSSVKRNKIKRTVFSVFENNPAVLGGRGKDYLVIVNVLGESDDSAYTALTKELESAVTKIKK